jgi:hypothetical protein
MKKAYGPVKAKPCYSGPMPKQDPDRLAAALRENLKKRKAQGRDAAPEPSFGSDEEGDVAPTQDGDPPAGSWVAEGSKKN